MEYKLSKEIEQLRIKTRDFVNDIIIPLESNKSSYDDHENINQTLLDNVRKQAKASGLWAPQMPIERSGLGLGPIGMAVLYEEMNRSIFGPVCFNCAAPDDGNMYILNKIASTEQKVKWLDPIINGDVRSALAMTEPAPGGGSDPSMIKTEAVYSNNKWVVNGLKWYITGAGIASHFILLAKTKEGLTAFLYHKDQPGWNIKRRIPIMGPEEHGGHCEIEFNGLEIPDENRLGEVGQGLKIVQIRLGLARLTHCMRWIGLSKRSLEIALEYVSHREGFGIKLADRESIQIKLGKAAMDIDISRLLVMRAAWKIENGSKARQDVSMAKIHVAETLNFVCDTSIQLNGARGYSKDTILEWIYRYARQAKLVDGATEVHQMIINRFFNNQKSDFWHWGIGNDL
ncbi:acyl-CoA dehydrogenase family protein [Alphaproteobacteria bacterium]|nr:acyl-CoA dehydrogenase family protein [Alphaproteobacteria bacterium]